MIMYFHLSFRDASEYMDNNSVMVMDMVMDIHDYLWISINQL